jgi:hypothetical protein
MAEADLGEVLKSMKGRDEGGKRKRGDYTALVNYLGVRRQRGGSNNHDTTSDGPEFNDAHNFSLLATLFRNPTAVLPSRVDPWSADLGNCSACSKETSSKIKEPSTIKKKHRLGP